MDKLKILNPHASDLGDQYGIPIERRRYLSFIMDEFARSGGPRIVTLAYTLNHIQDHCESDEEFIWCTCNHIVWLYKTGRVLDSSK